MNSNTIALMALKASDPKTGFLDRQKFARLIIESCAQTAAFYSIPAAEKIVEKFE